MKQLTVLLLLVLCFYQEACKEKQSPTQSITPSDGPTIPLNEQVQETIFRHQIGQSPDVSEIKFLAVIPSNDPYAQRTDPSDDLVNRIRTDYPNVTKYSQGHYGSLQGTICFLDSNSTESLLFTIWPLQWLSNTKVQTTAEMFANEHAWTRNKYYIQIQNNSLVIDSIQSITPSDGPTIPLNEQVQETIFRHQIGQSPDVSEIKFLAVILSNDPYAQRTDPSDDLVNRIRTDYPNVTKYSQGHYGSLQGTICFLDSNSTESLLFTIWPLQWLSNTKVQTTAEMFANEHAWTRNKYYIQIQNNSLVIDSIKQADF